MRDELAKEAGTSSRLIGQVQHVKREDPERFESTQAGSSRPSIAPALPPLTATNPKSPDPSPDQASRASQHPIGRTPHPSPAAATRSQARF
jgi:hypothetical protein